MAPNFDKMASPTWWEKLLAHVRVHKWQLAEDKQQLAERFDEQMQKDGGWLAVVRGYQAHLTLRFHQEAKYQQDVDAPEPSTLYCGVDFAVGARVCD